MIDIKQIVENNPDCLLSRSRLKGILKDYFPNEKREINVVLAVYESGIAENIRRNKDISAVRVTQFLKQIEAEFGIASQYAIEGIQIWASVYGLSVDSAAVLSSVQTGSRQKKQQRKSPEVVPVIKSTDDYKITERNGDWYIKEFLGFEKEEMIIPNVIRGRHIIGIAESAFKDCQNINKVVIAEGIKYIKDFAFMNCKSLKALQLPSTLEEIGAHAIQGAAISEAYIPESVTEIGEYAFSGCPFLKSIDIPETIKIIPKGLLMACQALESVYLPDDLTAIEESAFKNCISLRDIILPEEVEEIGSSAFSGCTRLLEIEIPNKVKRISESLFENCIGLTTVTLNEGLSSIGGKAFEECGSLNTLLLPSSVKNIAYNAFSASKITGKGFTLYCYPGSYGIKFARDRGINIADARQL